MGLTVLFSPVRLFYIKKSVINKESGQASQTFLGAGLHCFSGYCLPRFRNASNMSSTRINLSRTLPMAWPRSISN